MERVETDFDIASIRAVVDIDGFNPNGYFVYLLWGPSEDRPVYIGTSRNVLGRLGRHLTDAKKRHHVARVTLLRCNDADAMAETEGQLISFYRPELNLVDGSWRRMERGSGE